MTQSSPQPRATPRPAAERRPDPPDTTLGDQLRASPAVGAAIDAIVAEVEARAALITGVRGPAEALRAPNEERMKRAAEVRGRGLLYPYLGSGLGRGALVELMDGSVKWDMICGIGVHFFGHSDPDLVRAALEAGLDDVVKHGNLQSGFDAYEFAETLLGAARRSSRVRHAYLATSGAMANENALKVCYQKNHPASRVLAFRDCFMGRSTTMAQIGDSAEGRVGLPLTVPVDYVPFWDEAAAAEVGKANHIDAAVRRLEEHLTRYPGQHACFVFELVQGEGGFNVGDRDFFVALMEVCRTHGIAVWIDEIQTFGRLPEMFAYEYFNLGEYVDVLTVGKMTQACATLYTEPYNPKPGLLSGTFTGEGVSFRVGRRIIERLRDGGYYGPNGRLARHHSLFRERVRALASRHPEWFPPVPGAPDIVGGVGGMMRFTPFGGRKDRITRACRTTFDEGVILFYAGHGPHHLRLLPPLGVMREEDWPGVFECIERGLARAATEAGA